MEDHAPRQQVFAAWVVIVVTLIEAMWIIAVPPFRGMDEFDHAYRADYVARGNWQRPTTPAASGRGAVVSVRESIVDAARPVCESFKYTGPDNCRPITSKGGLATVATGAFAYGTTYYWLIGTPALAFDGVEALFVMRVTSALLCAMVTVFACAALRSAFGPRPVYGLLIGLTPTVAYTFSILGPNGLEIAAGAGSWAGLMALARGHDRSNRASRLWILATAACCTLLTVLRPLGPLWLLLIAISVLVAWGWRPWAILARRSPVALSAAVLSVGAGVFMTARGVLQVQVGVFLPGDIDLPDRGWAVALNQFVVWVFQGVAAFPSRDEVAPLVVYALQMGVMVTWLALGVVASRGRLRVALLLVITASLVVPVLIAAEILGPLASTWQGRYSLPFALGGVVVAGLALVSAPALGRFGLVASALGGLALLSAQLISASTVYERQLTQSGVRESGWPFFPPWSLALLAGLAALALAAAVAQLARGTTERNLLRQSDL
jgi:hypothetical protein